MGAKKHLSTAQAHKRAGESCRRRALEYAMRNGGIVPPDHAAVIADAKIYAAFLAEDPVLGPRTNALDLAFRGGDSARQNVARADAFLKYIGGGK